MDMVARCGGGALQRESTVPTAGATDLEDVVLMGTKDAWSKELNVLAKGVMEADATTLVVRPEVFPQCRRWCLQTTRWVGPWGSRARAAR